MQLLCPRRDCGHPRADHRMSSGPCDTQYLSGGDSCACHQYGAWMPTDNAKEMALAALAEAVMRNLEADADHDVSIETAAAFYEAERGARDFALRAGASLREAGDVADRVWDLFSLRTGISKNRWYIPSAEERREEISDFANRQGRRAGA
jgi:hypothetical protein